MSLPRVVAVAPGSPADRAGVLAGDALLTINGALPRDVVEYRWLTDAADVDLEISRGGPSLDITVTKAEGEPLGVEVDAAIFDRVRTCDNHCEFCFIHQLPPGMRKSLYLKDDDYRLSFLYGNFTTLTRFTEADLERVLTQGLAPLYVSIHATDPDTRAEILRNPRGGTSLRWLRALLDHGVEVHGQIVVCPGINDAAVLDDTLTGILDEYPELATVCVVPLGVSRFNTEPRMRPHTLDEATAVVDLVEQWQARYLRVLGRRMVFAADEYYLLAGRAFPPATAYEDFAMHEDGVGMARTFELEFTGQAATTTGPQSGFFAWVDGAPASGYRAPRLAPGDAAAVVQPAARAQEAAFRRSPDPTPTPTATPVELTATRPASDAPVGIVTGAYGAAVLRPLLDAAARPDVRIVEVANDYFGGTTAVTGLLVGQDIARALEAEPAGHRYLLPDVCLSQGRFLDGTVPADLPRPVEVVATDGHALRRVLERRAVAV